MNVLLINPSLTHVYGSLFSMSQIPLGLAYVAATLRVAGHTVEIIDINSQRISDKVIELRLINSNINLVGITTTTPTYNNALSLARIVKQVSGAYVVLGGVHVTMLPEESVTHPQIDFVIAGEGEITILELIGALENQTDLSQIDGLIFKRDGKIIRNRLRQQIDNLDSLPFPARDLFQNNKYTYPDSLYRKTAPIITSRGCFGKCIYCLIPIICRNTCRFRSAKNVVDEIESLKNVYGIQEIHFWDDNFIGLKNRVFEIKDELRARNIRLKYAFPNGIRADFVTEDILLALKDIGTYSIAIGVESGNQSVLNFANKNIKLSRIQEVFRMLKKLKFETWAFFMFGLPKEDRESIQETINFAKILDPDVAKFHIFKPFPGLPLFNDLKGRGMIKDFNYDNYGIHNKPVHHFNGITEEDISKWQKKAYKKFYLRPKKFFSHLFRLKSLYRIQLSIFIAIFLMKKMLFSKNE